MFSGGGVGGAVSLLVHLHYANLLTDKDLYTA